MKILILCVILMSALLIQVLVVIFNKLDSLYSQQTEILCSEYANRDHEKEFVPERWQLIKDTYTPQDWYQSCINHNSNK